MGAGPRGPKHTASRIYEGLFKEEMDAAALATSGVPYEPQLIDATAPPSLTTTGGAARHWLNRDGALF